MFCVDCGESVQPGSSFCGKCGGKVGEPDSAPAPAAPAPESDENPTWLKVLFVLWAFAYSAVGAFIFIFLLSAVVAMLGYDDFDRWLVNNTIYICVIIGIGNALTRGVAAARRM